MFTIREAVLILLVGLSAILSFNVARVIYECNETEEKTLTFERDICQEQQLINAEIKEIQDEEIPDINSSIGKHTIVL